MEKIFEKINKLINVKEYHLFLNNKEILSAKSLKSLKEKLKENFENPDKEIKGFIIKIGLPKEETKPLTINCSQYTITTNLSIVSRSREGDITQTFTYTNEELVKYGFKMSHIKKMIKVIKKDLLSFDGSRISISTVFNIFS